MSSARDRPTARIVRERLPGEIDGIAAAGWLRGEPRGVALSGAWLGGTTILSSHPLLTLAPSADPFSALDSLPFDLEPGTGDARLGGGWLGWLGFGLSRLVEPVCPPPPRALALPLFHLAFHDHVVVRDPDGSWWFEALLTEARADLLTERLGCWRARLASRAPTFEQFTAGKLTPTGGGLAVHEAGVRETIERIAAGELSQANLCLRLEAGFEGDPLDLWGAAAAAGRPAYAGYVAAGRAEHAVASLSPELFLSRTGRRVLTRPIKGTAPIATDPEVLLDSPKDRAENVMIVDLMRNDLGRVCRYGSVSVEELCALREAPGVWQLESTVSGELRAGVSDAKLLRATFPPGSVTGAPKVQALRTIHGLEATAREAYCGALGLCSPLAGLELNVAIRTLELARGRVWLGVGGGIVSDSSPEAEVAEALTKARGVAGPAGLELAEVRAGAAPPRIPVNRAARPDPAHGVIETIRVTARRAEHLADHLSRLSASCGYLGLSLPGDLEDRIAAAAVELTEAGLRISVGPGGVEIASRPLPPPAAMELIPLAVPGGLGAHKWADRRLIEMHSGPGRTPLICDGDGTVLEAGYAAVLAVLDRGILAPSLDGRLLGSVSREHLLRAARAAGWEIAVRDISVQDLNTVEGIVLTSSLRGPHPARLVGRPPAPRAAELAATLARDLAAAQARAASAISWGAAASAAGD